VSTEAGGWLVRDQEDDGLIGPVTLRTAVAAYPHCASDPVRSGGSPCPRFDFEDELANNRTGMAYCLRYGAEQTLGGTGIGSARGYGIGRLFVK